MASFSGPSLSNRIADDVPDIQALLSSLAKLTPDSGNVDYPVGTKRVAETANGYELQQYNGSSWVTLEQWNIDAQKLDGYSASTGTSASTIPVRNSAGKIPGDITGTAEKANEAKTLSETNPIGKGGTGATSAAEARANLGVAPISHASSGIEYGVSSANQYGHAKASATTPKALGTASAGTETTSFARGDHVHPITTATGDVVGMVKLSDSTSSTSAASDGVAASPKAVKAAYDLANTANNGVSSVEGDITQLAQEILDASASAGTNAEGSIDILESVLGTIQHEMGSWWISLDGAVPTGGLPHLGHLCQRSTYGDFWPWCEANKTVVTEEEWQAYANAHNGCCPYYSYGDGSTTFRTPKYDQSFLKVLASVSNAGSFQSAGLPGITGSVDLWLLGPSTTSSGALSRTPSEKIGAANSGTYNSVGTVNLDASASSPIYGNSDTVTPQNFGIIVGVYAVSAVSAPIGTTDAASVLNAVSGIDTRVGELENGVGRASAYITETWKMENQQWARKWSDGYIEQGGRFVQNSNSRTTVTFLCPFTNANYSVVETSGMNAATANAVTYIQTKTSTTVELVYYPDTTRDCNWYACGY